MKECYRIQNSDKDMMKNRVGKWTEHYFIKNSGEMIIPMWDLQYTLRVEIKTPMEVDRND